MKLPVAVFLALSATSQVHAGMSYLPSINCSGGSQGQSLMFLIEGTRQAKPTVTYLNVYLNSNQALPLKGNVIHRAPARHLDLDQFEIALTAKTGAKIGEILVEFAANGRIEGKFTASKGQVIPLDCELNRSVYPNPAVSFGNR